MTKLMEKRLLAAGFTPFDIAQRKVLEVLEEHDTGSPFILQQAFSECMDFAVAAGRAAEKRDAAKRARRK